MILMAVCGALLLAGVAPIVVWRNESFTPPPVAAGEPSARETARRFVWYAALTLTGGVLTGIAVIGGGGRLAMRLLAVTSSDEAQGRITEAEQIVGEITVEGTVGFIIFNGIIGGVLTGAIFLIIRRFLPAGLVGGLLFGVGLLVVLATTVDPLRSDNPDFDIVGPAWLAVALFTALALVYGLALSAVFARLSAWLPLLSADRSALVRYALPGAIAALAFSVTIILAVLCAIVIGVTRWRPIRDAVGSRGWIVGGRIVLIALVVVSLPHAATSLADIATR